MRRHCIGNKPSCHILIPYFNAGTGTGGSNSVTLAISQMPNHKHLNYNWSSAGDENAGNYGLWTPGNGFNNRPLVLMEPSHVKQSLSTTYSGEGNPHNNMPAYQTLYAWRRTA